MTVLMPDAGYAELLTLVLRGEIELEITVFLGVGRQLIGANIDLAPLEALSNVPNCQKVRAPGRKMVVLAFRLPPPLSPDPMVGRYPMAIGAGHVELAHLAGAQLLPALDRGLRIRACRIDLDRRSVGEKVEINRHGAVFIGLHQPDLARRGLGMPRDEFLDAQHLVEPRLPFRH